MNVKFLAHGSMPVRAIIALLFLISVAGCSSGRYPPAPAAATSQNYRYLIGAGDSLNIIVWRNPELSQTVVVRPDGRISTPLVEDVEAVGRNPQDLSRELEKALAKYIRDPVVTVIVSNFQGPFSEQIRIVGEAAKPQSIPYRNNMTVLDVMIAVGGLTDFADGNGAVLVRGSEGGRPYGIRLKDLLKRGDISANVQILPGDIIIIPQAWF